MAKNPYPYSRHTYVFDPRSLQTTGPIFLTRAQLVAAQNQYGVYSAQGFGPQFLWYAPMGTVTPSLNQKWSDCGVATARTEVDGASLCDAPIDSPTKTIGYDFPAGVTLTTIEYGTNWIALACGNYDVPQQLVPGTPLVPAPVPTITGSKYSDLNADGVREPGEPGVANWPITLTRISSTYGGPGQSPGYVTTVYTDANGNYRIPLNGIGPGTYQITEATEPGWTPDTGTTRTVMVDPGIGNATISVPAFGNHYEPPITATPATLSGTEGASISGVVATFTDPDENAQAAEFTATVDWGDGTSPSTGVAIVKGADGTFSVEASHTYTEEGTYSPKVTVVDTDNTANTSNTVTVTDSATVGDASLVPAGKDLTATEGSSVSGVVGAFTDQNPYGTAADFTATINWGDGTTSTGTVSGPMGGPFSVSGIHTYTEEGTYPTSVAVKDDGGSTTAAVGQVVVGDAALAATGRSIVTTNTLSDFKLATFTDQNPYGTATDFTATINWGDGTTSTGTVSGPMGGPFTVTGSHTYSVLGPTTIKVHIVDDGGATANATDPAIIGAPSNFVVGDQTVGPVTPGPISNGATVTFWGAQWWKDNSLSGGTAPAAFKGYADQPLPGSIAIGDTWTTRPGNSSKPPATVPSYMTVVVSSSIGQNGSTISGDVVHIVMVKTNPGYAGDPGHAGTGTVVGDVS